MTLLTQPQSPERHQQDSVFLTIFGAVQLPQQAALMSASFEEPTLTASESDYREHSALWLFQEMMDERSHSHSPHLLPKHRASTTT